MNLITPNKSVEIEEVVEYVASVCDNVEFLRGVPVNLPSETKALLRDRIREALHQQREMMRKDLLEIAEQGEYEDLRREVENYFPLPVRLRNKNDII